MRENGVHLPQDTLACKHSRGRYCFRKRQIPISLMADSFLSRLKLEIIALNLSIKVNRLSEPQIMNSSLFIEVTLFPSLNYILFTSLALLLDCFRLTLVLISIEIAKSIWCMNHWPLGSLRSNIPEASLFHFFPLSV